MLPLYHFGLGRPVLLPKPSASSMATTAQAPTNGTEAAADRVVSPRDFHGISLESPQQPVLASLPPGVEAPKAVTLGQSQPSPQRMMEGTGGVSQLGTPAAREPVGGSAGTAMRRPGSAGALSASSAPSQSPMSYQAHPLRGPGALTPDHPLRGISRSPHAPGPQTFNREYMAFAAGFSHMADAAPAYRSTRLSTVNPTAAADDDMSFYYTLDSGRTEPGAMGEHIRGTRGAARSPTGKGGFFGSLMAPIE